MKFWLLGMIGLVLCLSMPAQIVFAGNQNPRQLPGVNVCEVISNDMRAIYSELIERVRNNNSHQNSTATLSVVFQGLVESYKLAKCTTGEGWIDQIVKLEHERMKSD